MKGYRIFNHKTGEWFSCTAKTEQEAFDKVGWKAEECSVIGYVKEFWDDTDRKIEAYMERKEQESERDKGRQREAVEDNSGAGCS